MPLLPVFLFLVFVMAVVTSSHLVHAVRSERAGALAYGDRLAGGGARRLAALSHHLDCALRASFDPLVTPGLAALSRCAGYPALAAAGDRVSAPVAAAVPYRVDSDAAWDLNAVALRAHSPAAPWLLAVWDSRSRESLAVPEDADRAAAQLRSPSGAVGLRAHAPVLHAPFGPRALAGLAARGADPRVLGAAGAASDFDSRPSAVSVVTQRVVDRRYLSVGRDRVPIRVPGLPAGPAGARFGWHAPARCPAPVPGAGGHCPGAHPTVPVLGASARSLRCAPAPCVVAPVGAADSLARRTVLGARRRAVAHALGVASPSAIASASLPEAGDLLAAGVLSELSAAAAFRTVIARGDARAAHAVSSPGASP